jgi:hypothetical protein
VDGPKLDDRVVAFALDPSGADDEAVLGKREIGCVEEEDLTHLAVQRVHPQIGDRRALIRLRDREFELDAVGLLRQIQQLSEFLVGQRRERVARCHRPPIQPVPARLRITPSG